jgi:hypothetical protein
MAQARYLYIDDEGKISGPFWLTQMREWFKEGKITLSTEICMEGTNRWETADFFPEICGEEASLPACAKIRRAKSDNNRLIAWLFVLLLGFAVYLLQRWSGK